MPRSRPRLTVRRLMVVVALASLFLGAAAECAKLARRRAYYKERAAMHGREMGQMDLASRSLYNARVKAKREGIVDPNGYLGLSRIPAPYSMLNDLYERGLKYQFRSDWHERMKKKYEQAAERPWLAVEPDTPEPE